MKSNCSFIALLIAFSCFISFSECIALKKTNLKKNVFDTISEYSNKATSLLKEVQTNGKEVQKKLSPVKEYYVALEGVLADFKKFLTAQNNVVVPSVSGSEANYGDLSSKFTQISDLSKTVKDTIEKYSSVISKAAPDATAKVQSVAKQVTEVVSQVDKYKGYADKIKEIMKAITEQFDLMKNFDDTKITELKKFVEDFDKINNGLEKANTYVNDLIATTSKVSSFKDTVSEAKSKVQEAKNKVSNFFGGLW